MSKKSSRRLFIAMLLFLSLPQAEARADDDSVAPQNGTQRLFNRPELFERDRNELIPGTWELDAAFAGPFQAYLGQSAFPVSEVRVPVRYFIADGLSVGVDGAYWAGNYYSFNRSTPATSGVPSEQDITGIGRLFGFGPGADYHFLVTSEWDAFGGLSFLWVPAVSQELFCPEVGVKYFISNGRALGLAYDVPQNRGSSPSFDKRQEVLFGFTFFL